ncbi:MAG TPA: tyrosine-type recombinase/integrase [Streptosporangiaceae bacterium]|nr:tyrosine-type recombinase/integrase [Streptosporangiaceae bacterium]
MAPENTASRRNQRPELTPENTAWLAEYRAHLDRSPLTGHSRRTYLGVVAAYLAWLGQAEADGDPLNDATAKDWAVRDYRSYLVTVAKRATATVNKHLAALADFYTWRGLGQPHGVKRHRPPQRAPRALEPRAKLRYLRAVEACPRARDRALALLPLYAGCRIAEIAALDVADVRLSARKGELHLVGKGEKSRTVPVHPQLRAALTAWLAERPSCAGADSPALFLSGRGTRLTTDAIDDAIQGIARGAALDDHVTSHVLRHTFGTELTRSGVDIVTVAELMGHGSLETTRLYTRPTADDMQRAVDLLSADG